MVVQQMEAMFYGITGPASFTLKGNGATVTPDSFNINWHNCW